MNFGITQKDQKRIRVKKHASKCMLFHYRHDFLCKTTPLSESKSHSTTYNANHTDNPISFNILHWKKKPCKSPEWLYKVSYGADNRIRTDDLILTKDVLCLLSYISVYRSPNLLEKVAGAEGFEPSARGFGDHCSTSWAIPLFINNQGEEPDWWLNLMVGHQGLEPRTNRLWAGSSDQLS